MKQYRLCYIDGNKAWFTDNFDRQWGDDWDDRPYQCNAEEPYDSWREEIPHKPPIYEKEYKEHPINLKTLYFETNDWSEKKPCDMGSFSVKDINKGAVAWIHTENYNIVAGTSMEEFIKVIEEHGGKIYLERK